MSNPLEHEHQGVRVSTGGHQDSPDGQHHSHLVTLSLIKDCFLYQLSQCPQAITTQWKINDHANRWQTKLHMWFSITYIFHKLFEDPLICMN